MSSMVKHEGKPTYLVDQIQSDWGQKLRDGGVRDEAKIAELEKRIDAEQAKFDALVKGKVKPLFESVGQMPPAFSSHAISDLRTLNKKRAAIDDFDTAGKARSLEMELMDAHQPIDLLNAELRTAKASSPGHPLVNTTDQWTNTTLRHALKQAVDSGAEYIAIPHGDTVLSYNPGDTNGMRQFYGSRTLEGIVPKNLRKMLEKMDPNAAKQQRVESISTSSGSQGWNTNEAYPFDKSQTGFTVFPITDKVREAVKSGQALFSNRNPIPGTVIVGASNRNSKSEKAMQRALEVADKYD